MRRAAIAVVVLAAGCAGGNPFIHGSAQERKVEAGKGGVVALFGDQGKALAQAEPWMRERCGGPFRIVSEEEVVVGSNPNAWAGGSHPTEHRITYECGAASTASR